MQRPGLLFVCAVLLLPTLSCKRNLSPKDLSAANSPAANNPRKPNEKLLKHIFLGGDLELAFARSAKSETNENSRHIIPIEHKAGEIYRYLLLETDKEGKILTTGHIVSKNAIANIDLFALSIQKDTILYYEHTLYPNTRYQQKTPAKGKVIAKISGQDFDSNTPVSRAPLPCDATNCVDWYWIIYNADTGEIISTTYLYTTCTSDCDDDPLDDEGVGGNGDNPPPGVPGPYICASSFNFQSQGTGSITNVAKTWGIIGSYVTSQSTYTTTFGVITNAPKDVVNWNTAWSYLSLHYYYLIQSGDIRLQTDMEGTLHLTYSAFAQKQLAAAACDYASDNSRNPKSVLSQPNGGHVYKQKFKELYSDYLKTYIPGTTVQLLNTFEQGCTQATYSNTPC
jgi:hypothetical protein